MPIDYFPKIVVTGEAFCNRQNERARLADYIMKGRHVWLQAHRRQGKTSLVAQTIEDLAADNKISYFRCHLRFASDMESTIRKLIQSVDALINAILVSNHPDDDIAVLLTKFGNVVNNVFRKLKPSIVIQGSRPIISTTQTYDLQSLEDALLGLDSIAGKFGYRAVLLVDEFQEIGKLVEHLAVESTIRQVVEDAKHITFIFAGSERSLMDQALSQKKRPLYKHTQAILLERIAASEYKKHLNALARKKWQGEIPEKAFEQIMYLTQRHPYYVNSLCDELWLCSTLPTQDSVAKSWNAIVHQSGREDANMVRSLSLNEKKLVIAIAGGLNTKMTSGKVSTALKMTSSSIQRALESLSKKDVIDRTLDVYFIVDPALAAAAVKFG